MKDKARDQLRSFLLGSLLGDAYAAPESCQWTWGNVDRAYVEWKAAFARRHLGLPCRVRELDDASCRDGKMYCFTAAGRHGRLRVYRQWFYPGSGKKRITKHVRHLDHPIGLVILILDQGSCRGGMTTNSRNGNPYYRKPTVRIHLNAHSRAELELFQKALNENFGLETSLQRKSTGYLDVYFNTRQTQLLWSIIKDYVPDLHIARKKFHPIISQTTNAHLIQRPRGVEIA